MVYFDVTGDTWLDLFIGIKTTSRSNGLLYGFSVNTPKMQILNETRHEHERNTLSIILMIRSFLKHPWLSMYIQGLLLNGKESLNPNDCHCGKTNCTGYDPSILVSTQK